MGNLMPGEGVRDKVQDIWMKMHGLFLLSSFLRIITVRRWQKKDTKTAPGASQGQAKVNRLEVSPSTHLFLYTKFRQEI